MVADFTLPRMRSKDKDHRRDTAHVMMQFTNVSRKIDFPKEIKQYNR
jgi:hypothetical protein